MPNNVVENVNTLNTCIMENERAFLEIFREINDYVNQGYEIIDRIDPVLRIPFFSFVNSPIIQDKLIFPNFHDYKYIFDLYDVWALKIRLNRIANNPKSINNDVVNENKLKNDDPCDLILGRKYYLTDRYHAYLIANDMAPNGETKFTRYYDIADNEVCQRPPKNIKCFKCRNELYIARIINELYNCSYDPYYLIKSSADEIAWAMENDWLWVMENVDNHQLVAASIIITNPNKALNQYDYNSVRAVRASNDLGLIWEQGDFAILDSLIINENCRGLGLMRMSLMFCSEIARASNKRYVYSTVSPNNNDYKTAYEDMEYTKSGNTFYEIKEEDGKVNTYPRLIMKQNIFQ